MLNFPSPHMQARTWRTMSSLQRLSMTKIDLEEFKIYLDQVAEHERERSGSGGPTNFAVEVEGLVSQVQTIQNYVELLSERMEYELPENMAGRQLALEAIFRRNTDSTTWDLAVLRALNRYLHLPQRHFQYMMIAFSTQD
ncbi:uncharacterized protein [Ptychodera flava]|uniref:uncharacterized protein n=1 Tax=Ptychodera flava TaxID=63121 RepID=UPI00396A4093